MGQESMPFYIRHKVIELVKSDGRGKLLASVVYFCRMINVVFNIVWLYKTDKHSFIQFKPCYIFDKYKIGIVDDVSWIFFCNFDNRNLFDRLPNLIFLFF